MFKRREICDLWENSPYLIDIVFDVFDFVIFDVYMSPKKNKKLDESVPNLLIYNRRSTNNSD